MQIANFGNSDQSVIWYAKKIDKPTFSLTESEHKYLMHSYYFPGKLSWNEITATVVDPGGETDVMTTLAQAMEASGKAAKVVKDGTTRCQRERQPKLAKGIKGAKAAQMGQRCKKC